MGPSISRCYFIHIDRFNFIHIDRISYIHVDGSRLLSSLTLCCLQSARLTPRRRPARIVVPTGTVRIPPPPSSLDLPPDLDFGQGHPHPHQSALYPLASSFSHYGTALCLST